MKGAREGEEGYVFAGLEGRDGEVSARIWVRRSGKKYTLKTKASRTSERIREKMWKEVRRRAECEVEIRRNRGGAKGKGWGRWKRRGE